MVVCAIYWTAKTRTFYKTARTIRDVHVTSSSLTQLGLSKCKVKQEGLAVASIARDVVVEMAPPREDNAR